MLMGFCGISVGIKSACSAGDLVHPWVWEEDALEEGTTRVFLPAASMDGGAWRATVHGVTRSRT